MCKIAKIKLMGQSSNFKTFRIVIYEGKKKIFDDIFSKVPIIIGRNDDCDICLKDYRWLSRCHAEIVEIKGEFYLKYLGNNNGIFFQGEKVAHVVIKDNDQFETGSLKIRFNIDKTVKTNDSAIDNINKTYESPATEIYKDSNKKSKNYFTSESNKQGAGSLEETIVDDIAVSDIDVDDDTDNADKTQLIGKAHLLPAKSKQKVSQTSMQAKSQLSLKYKKRKSIIRGLQALYQGPRRGKEKARSISLEVYATWKDIIYDIGHFCGSEQVRIGPTKWNDLIVPSLEDDILIASCDNSKKVRCFIPDSCQVYLRFANKVYTLQEIDKSRLTKTSGGLIYQLGVEDHLTIVFPHETAIHFRFAPTPRRLSKYNIISPDQEIQKTALGSGIIHLFIALIAIFNIPKNNAPHIPGVPQRMARLLVEPARKLIEFKPTPKPKPVVLKKEPPKEKSRKIQPKPEKVVIKKQPKINKFPMDVKRKRPNAGNVIAKADTSTEIKKVGALAAFGAISSNTGPALDSGKPVAININPNAGGMSGPSMTGGVIGALHAKGGKLQSGGGFDGVVRTGGKGYGTGTGFGIQGIKGTAGGRAIAGAVIGIPKLMKITKEEGLSQKVVMSIVQKHIGAIQQCYERSLLNDANLAGRIEYEWEITPAGQVTWVRVKKSDMNGADALNECVTKIFKKMKFPTATNGQSTTPNIGFPFGRL